MAEDEKRQDEDTEGNMPFSRSKGVSPEGTSEDAEGQAKRSLGNEESEAEDDAKGQGGKWPVANEEGDLPDDTEGHKRA
jgi:hypothetical protein